MNFLKKISIRYWLPNRCRRCLSNTRTRLAMCRACIDALPWLTPSSWDNTTLDHIWAAFRFETPIQEYVHGLKFSKRWDTAKLMSELMAERLLASHCILPKLILPVPLHPSRLAQRGYNQASILAKYLAKSLNVAFDANCIIRVKKTKAQAQLKFKDRENNLANAFNLIKPILYNHIALVDDVYTTGSTLKSLANMIRSQSENPIQIDAICVARAQRKIT